MPVCKQSPHCFCSLACLPYSTCQFVFDCLFVNVHWQLNCWSSVSTFRVFFSAGNFTCNLTAWPELLFLPYAIASPFDISPLRFLWDVKCSIHKSFDLNIHVKLKKTSETSKSFENSIQSCAIQSAFETSHNFSSW